MDIANRLDKYIEHARVVRRLSLSKGEKVRLDEKSIETLKSLGYIQ